MRKFPGLFMVEPTVQSAVTFLQGYDAALFGVPLEGFHYWLELKWNPKGIPRHWAVGLPIIARRIAGRSASQKRVLDEALALLEKFFAYRQRYGIAKVVRDYMDRRHKQIAKIDRTSTTDIEVPSNASLERTRGR